MKQIIKEEFKLHGEKFNTKRVVTLEANSPDIGSSLYDQSELKMAYDERIGVYCVPKQS